MEKVSWRDMKQKCINFITILQELLPEYEMVGSCNHDVSLYLIPNGTQDQITYHSKPAKSFRMSDHWNWYANINKCENENYIQCLSVDVPYPRKRLAPGKPSKSIVAYQVAFCGENGVYHAVYGETYNRKTKTWGWIEATPEEVVKQLFT